MDIYVLDRPYFLCIEVINEVQERCYDIIKAMNFAIESKRTGK